MINARAIVTSDELFDKGMSSSRDLGSGNDRHGQIAHYAGLAGMVYRTDGVFSGRIQNSFHPNPGKAQVIRMPYLSVTTTEILQQPGSCPEINEDSKMSALADIMMRGAAGAKRQGDVRIEESFTCRATMT